MPNYIFQDLRTNAPNCKLEERLLQGSTARVFAFTLFDRAKQALLDPAAELTLTVLYEPQFVNGVLTTKGSFVMDKQNPNYNIAVRETQIDEKFSIIYAPFVEEYTAYAGNCELILQIIENGITTYTYGMSYFVDRNDAYMQKSLPNNLPTYKDLQKQIQLLADGKAAKDLTNVDLPTFKAKVIAAGFGHAETAAQIKDLLEKAAQPDKPDYTRALTGQPTANDYARAIESLSGANKIAASAIRDLPDPSRIALNDLSNVGSTTLNTAIEGTDVGRQVVDNTRILVNKASKDLSDVSDSDFEKKGKVSNFAQNDLAAVDIQKLNEKGKIAGFIETIKVGETHGNYNEGDVKELQFHNDLDVTIDTQNKVATISVAPSVAKNDMKGILPETLSDKIKLTNAYQDLLNKSHPSVPVITMDDIKKLFDANFYEETSNVDLSQAPFIALTLFMQYQMAANNQTLTQQLPPVSQNKVIMISKVDSTGITGTTLTIIPNTGESINGKQDPVSFGADKSGYLGYFLPLANQNGYEFIPHEVAHNFGLAVSDDKNNVILGKNSIQFKKATISENGDILVITPDVSSGGGINGIGIIDSGGASTTDVTVLEFPQATVVGSSGKATITLPNSGQGGLEFQDDQGRKFSANLAKSTDKSIRISNMGNSTVDLSKGFGDHNEGIHALLGNDQIINSKYGKSRLYFADLRVKGGMFVYKDMNTKSFIIQDTDPQDDPDVSGGTTFIVGLYYEPNKAVDNKVTQDGKIKVYLADDKDVPLVDINGEPFGVEVDYKANDIIKPIFYVSEVKATASQKVHMKIEPIFANEEMISVGSNTQICLQSITKDESGGLALLSFMAYTGYRLEFDVKYYGYNFLNLARDLVFDSPEVTTGVERWAFAENMYLDFKSPTKVSISNYHLSLVDDGQHLPVWTVVGYLNKLDTFYTRGKKFETSVTVTNKDCALNLSMLKFTGDEVPEKPCVVRYFNSNPEFTTGWTLVDNLFISEDGVNEDTKHTKIFTAPQDANYLAIMLYPTDSTAPRNFKIKDLEVDITPWFNKVVVTNNSHTSEKVMLELEENYGAIVYTPSGYGDYRYTANSGDTKVPAGKITGGDGKLVNNNAWNESGSIDPEKVQGDYLFKVDGKVKMRYQARCRNEQNSINNVEFRLTKVNGDGTFTDVPNSKISTTIEANRTTPKNVQSIGGVGNPSDGWFAFEVKAGESYRMFMKSDKDDGFYIQSELNGEPLFRADIVYDEFTVDEKGVFDRLNALEKTANEVKFVDENGHEVFNKVLVYNTSTGKFSVEDVV